jgi:protein-tyrosine phosphatase
MAEGVFQQMVNEVGLAEKIQVDSAGTGDWHAGEQAHSGTRRVLATHGIGYNGRARQITAADMKKHQYIVAMDESNVQDLMVQYGRQVTLYRLLDFASQTHEPNVPDPYYTGNFEYVYQLLVDGCQGLLETIRRDNGL